MRGRLAAAPAGEAGRQPEIGMVQTVIPARQHAAGLIGAVIERRVRQVRNSSGERSFGERYAALMQLVSLWGVEIFKPRNLMTENFNKLPVNWE